jgi:hypothetical protein
MKKIAQALFILAALVVDVLEGACPKIQKFVGTSATSCKSANAGVAQTLTCDTAITNFAISTWFKLPTDDSLFGDVGNSDVFFAIMDPAETYKRYVLRYKFSAASASKII